MTQTFDELLEELKSLSSSDDERAHEISENATGDIAEFVRALDALPRSTRLERLFLKSVALLFDQTPEQGRLCQGRVDASLEEMLDDVRGDETLALVLPVSRPLLWSEDRARIWACDCATRSAHHTYEDDNECDGETLFGALLTARKCVEGRFARGAMLDRFVELQTTEWYSTSDMFLWSVRATSLTLASDETRRTPWGEDLFSPGMETWPARAAQAAARSFGSPSSAAYQQERAWQAQRLIFHATTPDDDFNPSAKPPRPRG